MGENTSERKKKCEKDPNWCLTYKEDPQIRANRRGTQDALEDKAQGPPVSLSKKDGPGEASPGVGQSQGSAEPG